MRGLGTEEKKTVSHSTNRQTGGHRDSKTDCSLQADSTYNLAFNMDFFKQMY